MEFGSVDTHDALGCLLAHSIKTGKRSLKKGHRLTAADIQLLSDEGHQRLVVARLLADDIHEDAAADRLSEAVCGPGLRRSAAFTGRSNIYARTDGVLSVHVDGLLRFNEVDEAVTLATLPPFSRVSAGQMIGTLKIIPFAIPHSVLERCASILTEQPVMRLSPFTGLRAVLIQTEGGALKPSVMDATRAVTQARLDGLGSILSREIRCAHAQAPLAEAIGRAAETAELILIIGASAIVDRRDVIPAAIEAAGGRIDHFGMPVDPGNLLLLGRCGPVPVLGLPGCARSPKSNGFDWVLERLCAGLPVGRREIQQMGAGGLLKDIPTRPLPRKSAESGQPAARAPRIVALILAAGSSRRLGGGNKLLHVLDGKPVVALSADAVLGAAPDAVYVVTGHESEQVQAALSGRGLTFVHNPHAHEGMSTSLLAGLKAIPDGAFDAVLIVLGDMPLMRSATVERLFAAFSPDDGREICLPVHQGRRGHPILWSWRFAADMKRMTGDQGAKSLLDTNSARVCEVAIDDDREFLDVDTQAALHEAAEALSKRLA